MGDDDWATGFSLFMLVCFVIIFFTILGLSEFNEIKNNIFMEDYCHLKYNENYSYDVNSDRKEMICRNINTGNIEFTTIRGIKTITD